MDSPQPMPCVEYRSLRSRDYLLLLLVCGINYGFSLIHPRLLNSHETTHCLNVREMSASGDWLIPTYGGRPWLERPPAPHWMTAAGVVILGEAVPERAYRIGPIAIATLAVLVFARAMAACLGRTLGLMSGIILATMREFAAYATAPEADIFLAATVTIAGSLFMYAVFSDAKERRLSFVGGRSWPVVLFFLLLGAMNAMKGPLFGMFFIVPSMAASFALRRDRSEIRPFVWLWGWLLALAIGLAWPVIAYLQYPDILDLWAIDYGVRWSTGYLGQPFWYYFVNQPWNVFPWTIPVGIALFRTARPVWRGESPAMRFVWCWAIVPIFFFSLFKGKHHHYLLSCLAPAAVLAAVGARQLWAHVQTGPGWLRRSWLSAPLLGLPGSLAVYLLSHKLPGPSWCHVAWMIVWPLVVFAGWWIVARKDARVAFTGFCAIVIVFHSMVYEYRTVYAEEYSGDLEFIREVPTLVSSNRPLLVLGKLDPLTPSWPLFYLQGRGRLLHNETYLCDDRITSPDVFVICQQRDKSDLAKYGRTELLAQSRHARYEHSPTERYSLYLLTFHPDLVRAPATIRMTPLQATGRDKGPFLVPLEAPTGWARH